MPLKLMLIPLKLEAAAIAPVAATLKFLSKMMHIHFRRGLFPDAFQVRIKFSTRRVQGAKKSVCSETGMYGTFDGTVGRHENMIVVMMYRMKSDRTRGTGQI